MTDDGSRGRGRIEQAALDEFLEKGYSGARTKSISRRADVSEGNVFWHFGSKARLFEALMAPTRDVLSDHFQQAAEVIARQGRLDGLAPETVAYVEETVALMRTRRKALLVLLTSAQNTPYEHAREELVGKVSELVRSVLERHMGGGAGVDPFAYQMIAGGFLDGFVRILANWKSTAWGRTMYYHLVRMAMGAALALVDNHGRPLTEPDL